MPEQPRHKPRVSIVLTPEEREAGEALAEARGVKLSALLGMLIREEAKRVARREAR